MKVQFTKKLLTKKDKTHQKNTEQTKKKSIEYKTIAVVFKYFFLPLLKFAHVQLP